MLKKNVLGQGSLVKQVTQMIAFWFGWKSMSHLDSVIDSLRKYNVCLFFLASFQVVAIVF